MCVCVCVCVWLSRAVDVYLQCLRTVLTAECRSETVWFQMDVATEMMKATDIAGNCATTSH